jgi:hypothetical protein
MGDVSSEIRAHDSSMARRVRGSLGREILQLCLVARLEPRPAESIAGRSVPEGAVDLLPRQQTLSSELRKDFWDHFSRPEVRRFIESCARDIRFLSFK